MKNVYRLFTKSTKGNLLFRATRDGFTSQAFHLKCDGKGNTITIIQSNLNYVLGGFASSSWNSSDGYINDQNAFLFSLRRNGDSYTDKFIVKNVGNALFGSSSHGPTLGAQDIQICNQSNTSIGNYSGFGVSYSLPNGYTQGGNAQAFLAGNYNEWTTTEIEVYQIV